MNKILESVKFVVENSENVKINEDKIKDFVNNFDHRNIKHWIDESPFGLKELDDKDLLHFLLVFNAISFSYWGDPKWIIEYRGKKVDGAYGMIMAIGRAIENNIPILDMKYLSNIKKQDFERILEANVKIPLFNERLKIIKEISKVLVDKFEGDFSKFVEKAEGNALRLLDLIILNFPSFKDISDYKGREIYFYKRAQLLVSDIYQVFKGKGYGKLGNIKDLTACADYKLPLILRKLGILSYSEGLSKRIDKQIQITKNSEEEIEVRANTIWAVELIKEKLKKKIPYVDSIHVNDHLWLLGQKKSPNDKPYHLTRTVSY